MLYPSKLIQKSTTHWSYDRKLHYCWWWRRGSETAELIKPNAINWEGFVRVELIWNCLKYEEFPNLKLWLLHQV